MDTHTSSTLSIHKAAAQGDLERVKFLIDQGISVDARDELDRTPLHQAAWSEHVSIVKLLLEYNADPYAKSGAGITPLTVAIFRRLEIAGQHNQLLQTIKLLLQQGITADQLTHPIASINGSFLHEAAFQGDIEMVRLFLMHGADPNALNTGGEIAWYSAYNQCDPDIMATFLKHPNINPDIRIKNGKSVIQSIVLHIKRTSLSKEQYRNATHRADRELYAQYTYEHAQYIQCLKYFIFTGVTLDEQEIKQACNEEPLDIASSDFYPQIKELIDEALRIKKKAEEKLNSFPSIIAKHSKYFLLSSEEKRKAFLETANTLYAHHAKNSQPSSFFKLPREILDQIVRDCLLDNYNFPRVDTHVTSASSYEDPISSHTIAP
jgi:ankyrin repeat protein